MEMLELVHDIINKCDDLTLSPIGQNGGRIILRAKWSNNKKLSF